MSKKLVAFFSAGGVTRNVAKTLAEAIKLHPLKYGGYHDDKKRLFEVIKAEEDYILKSPGLNNRRIWIDLYDTSIDDETIAVLINHLKTIRHKILRLSLVGCSQRDVKAIKLAMKRANMDLYGQTQYFSDPEEAKRWLLGKQSMETGKPV